MDKLSEFPSDASNFNCLTVGRKNFTKGRKFRSGEVVIGIIFNVSIWCLEKYSEGTVVPLLSHRKCYQKCPNFGFSPNSDLCTEIVLIWYDFSYQDQH